MACRIAPMSVIMGDYKRPFVCAKPSY